MAVESERWTRANLNGATIENQRVKLVVSLALPGGPVNFRTFWHRHIHPWILLAVSLIAIAAVVADIVAPEAAKDAIRQHVPYVTLILLSLYVISYLEDHDPKPDRLAEFGIANIYRGRLDEGEMASYQRLLSSAQKELFIVGITLKDVSQDHNRQLLDRASAGCRIRTHLINASEG